VQATDFSVDELSQAAEDALKRMPKEPRDAAIAELRAGQSLTADEARLRLRAAAVQARPTPVPVPPAASPAKGVSNSIPHKHQGKDWRQRTEWIGVGRMVWAGQKEGAWRVALPTPRPGRGRATPAAAAVDRYSASFCAD
jgi:hypothetical protein